MSCDAIRESFALMIYGELPFEEQHRITLHLETCEDCRFEMATMRQVHAALDAEAPDLPPHLLQDCRRNLLVSLAALENPRPVPAPSPSSFFRRWLFLDTGMPLFAKAMGALALLAVGFFAGRALPGDPARARTGLGGASPAAYRVRSIEPDASGRVQVVVDETRQRTLSGEANDQRIRPLLLSAAREASDPGVRVETVDLLRSQSQSAEVRGALIAALQSDPNAGVRLKALEGLREWTSDPAARKALVKAVLTDTNPGVRTQAIDLLTQHREPSLVGVLQELLSREDNNYVRLRCRKVLQEMNASPETF